VRPAFLSGSDLNGAGVPAAGGYGQRRSVGRVQLDLDSLRSLAGETSGNPLGPFEGVVKLSVLK
jgi:hypothetical protein